MPELTSPGEARALDLAAMASQIQPFQPLSASNFGTRPAHWKDEGVLTFYAGHLAIVNGAGPDWEDKLNSLKGVQAVRLDDDHIAVRMAED